jgi:1-acyl-sn-glycerol-3-phosphate acyltransferase
MILPRIARLLLRLGGWTVVGKVPTVGKAVVIGAHHTSNWDGFWALVYIKAFGLDIKFFVKDSLFWFPLSTLLRSFGGIPLDRKNARASVAQAIAEFDRNETFYFGLAPEGTRGLRPGWKSGFYRIAEGAGVPVILAFFNYETRRLGLGPTMTLTGDKDADMEIIRSFYASSAAGRWPEKESPVVFTR